MHFIKLNLFFILMSNSGLYALNKDVLVHLISTISADKDKEIKKLKSKFDDVIDKLSDISDKCLDMNNCDVCEVYEFKRYWDNWEDNVFICDNCYVFYHKECCQQCEYCERCKNCCNCGTDENNF